MNMKTSAIHIRMRDRAALLATLTAFAAAASAQAATITAASGGGYWNNGSTWLGGVVPTAADDVIIPPGVTVSTQLSGTTVVALAKSIRIDPLGVLTGQDTVSGVPVGAPLTIQTEQLRILSTLTTATATKGVATAGDGDSLIWGGGTVTIKPIGSSSAGMVDITVEGTLKAGHGKSGGWVFVQSTNTASKFNVVGAGEVLAGNALGVGTAGNVVVTPFHGDVLLGTAIGGTTIYEPIMRAGDTMAAGAYGGNIGIYGTSITIGGNFQFNGPNLRAGDHKFVTTATACGGDVILAGVGTSSVVQTIPGSRIEAGQPGWTGGPPPSMGGTGTCNCPLIKKPKITMTGTTVLHPMNSAGEACNIFWEPPDLLWGGGVLNGETVSISGGSFTAAPEGLELDRIAAGESLTISVNPGDGVIDLSALTPLAGDERWFTAGKQIMLKTDNLRLPPGVELSQLMSPPPQVSPGEVTRLVCATPTSGELAVQRGETVSLVLGGGNCGSADDLVAVDAVDSGGWLQSSFSQVVPLQSMEYFLREVQIVVPANGSPGDYTELLWTTRSLSDPTVNEVSVIHFEIRESFCRADLNGDGMVEFPDYLVFLSYFDAESPRVDFNRDGAVDVVDYFEFLVLYDAGC